jgi:hypothetical protein
MTSQRISCTWLDFTPSLIENWVHFSSGFVLAMFGEVHENLPHQRVICEVVKILRIAIVRVVLGQFVVAWIARIVGIAFRDPSRGTFIKDFSNEGPTFSLTSPSDSIRVQAWVLTIFGRFGKATEVRYVPERNTLGASSHGHNGLA